MRSLASLGRRQLGAYRAVPLALTVLVLLVSAVATAWPRALAGVDDRQLAYEFDRSSAIRRDVIAVSAEWPWTPPLAQQGSTDLAPEVEEALGGVVLALEGFRASRPEPLRSVMGEARFYAERPADPMRLPEGADVGVAEVTLRVDPYLDREVDLVAGEWPDHYDPSPPAPEITDEEYEALTLEEREEFFRQWQEELAVFVPPAMEVAISAPAAEALEWDIGEQRELLTDIPADATPTPVVLTGVFEAHDFADPQWLHSPDGADITVVEDPDRGTYATVAFYLSPTWRGDLPTDHGIGSGVTTEQRRFRAWYPVDGSAVRGSEVGELSAQVVAAASQGVVLADPALPAEERVGAIELRFGSELSAIVDRVVAQQRIVTTVLAVVAAGPAGVAVAVLVLGARLVVARREPSLALLAARGASGRQLRGMAAVEGLLLGVPAAAIGGLLARLAMPGPWRATDVVVPLAVALVLAGALAAAARPGSLRQSRRDLGSSRGKLRWVAEAVVVGASAAALVALWQRGIEPSEAGIDLLAVATPLLLTFAVCVAVLRLYPVVLRLLARWLRRGSGLVGFLGAARGRREAVGGVVPVAAIVVGVSVALFSTVLLTTVSTGVRTAAWENVGAQIRLSGPIFDDEKTEALRQVEGVAHVATVMPGEAIATQIDGTGVRANLVAVDAEALRDVRSTAESLAELPEDFTAAVDGVLPAIVSVEVAAQAGLDVAQLGSSQPADSGDEIALGRTSVPIRVVGVVDALAGATTTDTFVIVDRASLVEISERPARPRVALISLEADADPDEVLEAIREVEPVAPAQSPLGSTESFLASPMASGMNTALTSAAVLAVLLLAVSIVLTQLLASPQRQRLLAVLRTLGLRRSQARGIVAWELAPLAAVGLLAGAILGIVVPWLVLAVLDVRVLTGGQRQPDLVLDPMTLGAVGGGIVALVAAVVWISTTLSVRADTAAALRVGEER